MYSAEPLSLGLTELLIVRPPDPIPYLGRWLQAYVKKKTLEEQTSFPT